MQEKNGNSYSVSSKYFSPQREDPIMKHLMLLCLIVLSLSCTNVLAESTNDFVPASLPSLIDAIRVDGPLNFCGEPVQLDNPDVRERLEKELLLVLWNRPQVILWLKRSTRYFPYIERILAQNNMPEDLKYIAVVESALLDHAGSSQGAVGYWQFIKQTGLHYGLSIDEHIDERRNFFASTKAAAAYLHDLHDLFGSWTLAAAAYNVGEDRLQNEKTSQKVDNYYDFHLPTETERYIFKIIAVKLIFSNPSRYGFHLLEDDYYQPLTFDRVRITLPGRTPLYLVAQASGTHFKQIKDLNPEFLGDDLPKGTHIVAVPKGAGESFHAQFTRLSRKWRQEYKMHIYIVKKGDSLSTIAEQFNVTLPALIAWNDLGPDNLIRPGEKLVIYQ
jgi:membrane-bound lytic murein transglycosylase D